jgi:AsmA protein
LIVPVPPSDATPAANPAATKPAAPATANAGLRKLMVNGDLKIGKLTRETLLVTDIAMHLKMRDAVLEISPLTAKLYQGLSSSSIRADLREAAPKIKANLNLKGFKIGDYLKAAMHKDIIEGTADVNVDLQLTAADTEAIKRSLNGSAAFKVNEGALKGINIPDLIRRARATLAGQPLPPASSQSTDFTELSGTVKIVDGLASNDDLLMKSPLLRIGGKGGVNLPQEQINYLVTAQLVNSLSGQGGAELKDLVGVPLPIRVTGSFSKPEWELDLKTALEARVKAQAKGVLDEALKDPQKVLKDPKSLLEGQKKSIEGLKKLFQ